MEVVAGSDAAEQALRRKLEGLIILGGQTTYETLRGLGRERVTTLGEVLPGVPLSMAGDTPVITKAGGFGADDLLATILGET